MTGPLDGIRVIDWTQWQMGPVATMMLAHLGATVVHIENRVTGDGGRGLWLRNVMGDESEDSGISVMTGLPYGKSAYFECNNLGKKSITLDVLKEKGKEVIYRLVKVSDVFVHNFRQGVPEKLRLDYETLRQYNPKLIYAAASGFGPEGPEAVEPAFDIIGLARSGMMTIPDFTTPGDPNAPPLLVQRGIADQMGAIMTAYGVLAALVARDKYDIGQKVDVSHLGSMIALQGLAIGMWLYTRAEPQAVSRDTAANPLWNWYKCKDGRWLAFGMGQSDRYWPTMCKALGIEHLEKDPRFEDMLKRAENCEELIAIMDKIFMTKSASEWMKILKETGDIICTPVQTVFDLIDDPQVLANNYIVDGNHELLGPVKVIGNPVRLSGTPSEVKCEAPEFGQHTEEVLIEIGGYSWEEIGQLRDEETI